MILFSGYCEMKEPTLATAILLCYLLGNISGVMAQGGGKPINCGTIQPTQYQNCRGTNCNAYQTRCFNERNVCNNNCITFPFTGCQDRCQGALSECLSTGSEHTNACLICCDTAAAKKCHTNQAETCCAGNFNQCQNP